MPIPNGGLITETNRQYYAGAQGFYDETASGSGKSWTFTFNTDLIFGGEDAWDPWNESYGLNNFKLYLSTPAQAGLVYTEYVSPYTVLNNTVTITGNIDQYSNIVVQLKSVEGGNYGNYDAYGSAAEENYNGYSYIKLDDIINNFIVAYVGDGKLVPSAKRTDIIFHAKRGLQEFSYDTLKSIKSQELSIPQSLSVILPQDYVNYVKVSWIDSAGVKHPIYPANNLTINPYENPLQDASGIPINDNFSNNVEAQSLTEDRWKSTNTALINGKYSAEGGSVGNNSRYGISTQFAQSNGWFTINNREGKMSFSSQLVGEIIVLEYVSDGLAYDRDTRVPKMAEEAMYAHILHAIVSTRANQPEYVIQRLKQERSAKLRNAKIRLSSIKLDEIMQVFRGQSKWIKH
jgi:hypothetical protein